MSSWSSRKTPRGAGTRLLSIMLHPDAAVPLHRQIYDDIRARILSSHLKPGMLLPSTRSLARDARVSRNTVVMAYDQLRAEGYLVSRIGGGTKVSDAIPESLLRAEPRAPALPQVPRGAVSRRARRMTELYPLTGPTTPRAARAFRHEAPAVDAFPLATWNRAVARAMRRMPPRHLSYGEPFGLLELRELVTSYLAAARGVRCGAHQVMITCGSQQALALAAGALTNPGDEVWMEDPGYPGARGAFEFVDAVPVCVPVDAEGLDVRAGERRAPNARAAFVTPSRQLPLGVRMSLERRRLLLHWARRARAWIIEDDRNSEFRYASRPITALQGLDADGCVVYMGTFSKVMFPALRLGYLVVPDALCDAFAATRHFADLHQSYIEQAAMVVFMRDGHFERHVRQVRNTYHERQLHLVAEARRYLGGRVTVERADAGMELIAWLGDADDDVLLTQRIRAEGVEVTPLTPIAIERPLRPGLILGYAGLGAREISEGIQSMARAIERHDRGMPA